MDIKIYYEDTDCGGVVYYANFLKYFERARTEYLADHGLSVAELQKQGTLFLVTHAELFYRSSAHYGETLEINTKVTPSRKTSLIFTHTIQEQQTHRVVVEGSATLVTVDSTGKVRRVPPLVLQALPNINSTD
ncbi:YbgC/FadM family acyl-CoA thioesterase [Candidatus Nitronereus thalassa]|uniref:YbgC/FadM family acyl-CoA thioesterase n=1 Tax=Candidatus Nitronereus thalassa TaxID=3020898 RepID=A0ABU3K9H2_9BACT|nr:YbgC/FadM family acyl-CoA thioesterase [Candidatus Nitronereus thalassa]MDT7043062.1 YbgC/FadM family acyl-CoA thioesterase [Candidatus Nitronereus thalassa]